MHCVIRSVRSIWVWRPSLKFYRTCSTRWDSIGKHRLQDSLLQPINNRTVTWMIHWHIIWCVAVPPSGKEQDNPLLQPQHSVTRWAGQVLFISNAWWIRNMKWDGSPAVFTTWWKVPSGHHLLNGCYLKWWTIYKYLSMDLLSLPLGGPWSFKVLNVNFRALILQQTHLCHVWRSYCILSREWSHSPLVIDILWISNVALWMNPGIFDWFQEKEFPYRQNPERNITKWVCNRFLPVTFRFLPQSPKDEHTGRYLVISFI